MKHDSFQKSAINQSTSRPINIILTGVRSAFIGPNLITETYRSAVTTIIIGLDADVEFRSEGEHGRLTRQPVIVIAPNTVCEIRLKGDVACLFCDALNDDHSNIDLENINHNIAKLRYLLIQGVNDQPPAQFMSTIFNTLGIVPNKVSRPEIKHLVSAIGREPDRFANVKVAAELAGMSTMRFQHVFSETLGMPFRRYRQWRRMGAVIRSLAQNRNLTEAAYEAGFSSSAHLSTAFKEMFGLKPSILISSNVVYHLSERYDGIE